MGGGVKVTIVLALLATLLFLSMAIASPYMAAMETESGKGGAGAAMTLFFWILTIYHGIMFFGLIMPFISPLHRLARVLRGISAVLISLFFYFGSRGYRDPIDISEVFKEGRDGGFNDSW